MVATACYVVGQAVPDISLRTVADVGSIWALVYLVGVFRSDGESNRAAIEKLTDKVESLERAIKMTNA